MEDENENENKIEIKNENIDVKLKIITILNNIYNTNSKNKKISITKENYEFIINYINNSQDENFSIFFDYLNDINLPIIKILIDGYIKIDFEEENKNKLILEILAKIFKIYFSQKIFQRVYKHLSKIFRKNILLKNIQSIQKFEKIFNVWKLLYNIDNNSIQNKISNSLKNVNFEILIKNKEFFGENSFIIEIYFTCSPIFNKMKLREHFYFITLYDDNKIKLPFSYLKFFDLNSAKLFQESNKMTFNLSKNDFSIILNDTIVKAKPIKNSNFNFNTITKIKLLNYFFYADVFQINIQMKNVNIAELPQSFGIVEKVLDSKIKKENYSNKYTFNLDLNYKDEINGVNMKINFDDYIKFKDIHFGNNREYIARQKGLESIKYYGGIECFIPLFKIIKYIMHYLGKNENKEEKDIIDYLNKTIIWIKDIIKIILRLISLSEKNYMNFEKVVIPLIGAFAEISHIINKLILSGKITEDYKKSLFNDEVIYSLFIAILFLRPNRNIIEMYKQIFEMDEKWNINFSMDYILFDLNNIKDSKFYWYFIFLFNYALFILIYNDSIENCPKSIIEQIDKILSFQKLNKNQIISNFILSANPFIKLIKAYYSNENNENIKIQYSVEYLKSNNHYLKILINLMKTVLNVKYLSKINKINFNNDNNIIIKLLSLLNDNRISFKKQDNEYKEIITSFYNYFEDSVQLEAWIGLEGDKLRPSKELLINELVDYHGEYHKIMKELFSFNRFWSKEKLFYNSLEKKLNKLKYKNINYYTRNFQRPIVYPFLDYKYRYPQFSKFQITDDFYNNNRKENNEEKIQKIEDDYNFNLDCPEFDEIVKKYNIEIFKSIKKNTQSYIEIFNVCLVKQIYHVKGTLFVLRRKHKCKIIFFSYSYDFENEKENIFLCNKTNKDKNNENKSYENNLNGLCFGQVFKCPEKEKNRKIILDIKDIRMILYKIYYYRKSAIEIFTETKSYFFNFVSTEDFMKFISIIDSYFVNSEFILKYGKEPIYYMPIVVNTIKKIGYLKMNNKITKAEFIDLLSNTGDNNDMCVFDIIILMNLIANRTYIDLNQYPIFPVLYIYDKFNKCFERNFKLHIGFQAQTEGGKKRSELMKGNYNDNKKDKENEEEEDNEDGDLFYFNTHYSNLVYITNYMVRLFPYSFCAIELQGNYFDDPNRLFFSIEKTLTNIGSQISDIRELIPEFFYLPEMFININNFNFLSLQNGTKVDDVMIPENIITEELLSNHSIFNIQNEKRKNLFRIFLFVMRMKNYLENMKENLSYWLNIIFGTQQKYLKKKTGQLFRTESYIDIDEETFKKYTNDNIIMKSVEFGLIPLQIIFDTKHLNNIKNRKFQYDKTIKNQKANNNLENLDKKDSEIYPNWSEKYWDNNLKITFKIKNGNGIGKLKIFNYNNLLYEIIDHYDEILDVFYNRRLNMFSTCSYDGFICTYIFPNKLISVIKHPGNLYYNRVFLSANPYPTIISYEKRNNSFSSYSLSGIFINKILLDKNKIDIILHFDIHGGCHKDRIEIFNKKVKRSKIYDLPFFNEAK